MLKKLLNLWSETTYQISQLPMRIVTAYRFAKIGILLGNNPKGYLPGITLTQKEVEFTEDTNVAFYYMIAIHKDGLVVKQVKSITKLSFWGLEYMDFTSIKRLLS
ncbi:hypothetical protein C9975_03010 [Thalassospira xiamenensis]|nr:hypothetical protein C9975_03010 [Thalassospira xiamenensis]